MSVRGPSYDSPDERRTSQRASAFGAAAVVAVALAVGLAFAMPPSHGEAKGFVQFLGRFHILALHLPIGALVAALLAEAVGMFGGPRGRARASAALDVLVPFLLAAAVVAFVLGVLLAYGGGQPAHLLALHRGTTMASLVAGAAAAVVWFRLRATEPEAAGPRQAFRALLALTAALMTVGAHFGGSITHGDDYLVEWAPGMHHAAPVASASAAAPATDPTVFADVVMPVLREHCVECHGPDKQKGRLRLDSLEAIRTGGKSGPAIIEKDSANSPLVARMRLPLGEDEHMPPSDVKQPTKDVIDLVAYWVDRGADPGLRVRDVLVPDGARKLLEQAARPGSAAPKEPAKEPVREPAKEPAKAPTKDAAKPSPTADERPAAGGSAVFASVVRPVLEARCGSCHAHGKAKGGLRTDSLAALATGGDSGSAVVPGAPGKGTLLARLRLPTESREHMPPRAQPQLTSGELALLSWWVGQGAPERASNVPAFALGGKATPPSASVQDATKPTTTTAATETPAVALPEAPLRGARAYHDVVAPLLAKRCGECHSGADPSSGTRFDDPAKLLRGDLVVPGKPAESALMTRMQLPLKHPDHMPPPDSPQPTRAEIEAIGAWIEGGAQTTEEAPTPPTPAAAAAPAERAQAAARVPPSSSGCGACETSGAPTPSDVTLLALVLAYVTARRRQRALP